ncbi:hypothetical protein POM88_048095 [Heracleum sosnowskyi]|uniref:CCHC-type domain-containing protein n=1 Tax=Heracleum sosnowskyi TaxID=360622 RepID=A0AAD8GV46_9APIA|nr:hypothetical protein POM88_048095 [Heracleum sosnowskyi]
MRGRLRIVSDDNLKTTTWAEVPEEYWREVLEKDVEIPIIHVPPLAKGSEIPEYGDCSLNFTIKLAHGGEFDEKFQSYVDGDTNYFDMCSLNNFHLMDLHSMCKELGIGEGCYDLWYCIPGRALDVEFVIPIDEEEDVGSMLDINLWKENKGIGVRRLLWLAAKSTTDYFFKRHMDELRKVAPRAYEWLSGKPRSQWSSKRKSKMEQRNTKFCTKPLKKLHKAMEMAGTARPIWNGDSKYLVTMTEGGHQIEWGHNTRTCETKKNDEEKKRQEEGVTAEAISKKVPKCTKCQKEGHNQRTCRSLVQKDEVQNKKQKVNATDANLKDNNERTKASAPTNSHSPKRTKQLARKTVRSSPLKHGVIVVPEVKNGGTVAVASHGGIVKPFKAPARVPFKTPLDVQPVRGQKYTSLKNLEAAKYEREKNKGKTKM